MNRTTIAVTSSNRPGNVAVLPVLRLSQELPTAPASRQPVLIVRDQIAGRVTFGDRFVALLKIGDQTVADSCGDTKSEALEYLQNGLWFHGNYGDDRFSNEEIIACQRTVRCALEEIERERDAWYLTHPFGEAQEAAA